MTEAVAGEDEFSYDAEDRVEARPWPRFWSRLLDLSIWITVVGSTAGLLFTDFVMLPAFQGSGVGLFGVVLLPFALALDALTLALVGNTPGRALVGLRVERLDGERVTIMQALSRNAQIWIFGMAFGIPIIALFTYNNNSSKLNSGKQTSWDEAIGTRVYNISNSMVRTVAAAVLVITATIADRAYSVIEDNQRRALANASTASNQNREASTVDPIAAEMATSAATVKTQMLDEITRLDSASSEGRTYIYHYTILRRDVDDKGLAAFFQKSIVPKTCADTNTVTLLRDFQASYRYEYTMPNKADPLVFNISWSDCQKLSN